jgi:hypothetical protein
MNMPTGYQEADAKSFGEFETLEAGGYICKILKAEEQTSKSGKQMLVIFYDIAEGEHKDYYKREFERIKEKNPDAKWKGTYYQLTEGNSTSYFKGLITSIEESNAGYKWDFNESTLKGKLFGGAIGLEEWDNGKKNGMQPKLRYVTSVESIRKGITPPKDKMLDGSTAMKAIQNDTDFSLIDEDEDFIPF